MVVEITQDDINRGAKGAPDRCAVALAMRRLPWVADVSVTHNYIRVYRKQGLLGKIKSTFSYTSPEMWVPPREMGRWISNFDLHGLMGPVEPQTFVIEKRGPMV